MFRYSGLEQVLLDPRGALQAEVGALEDEISRKRSDFYRAQNKARGTGFWAALSKGDSEELAKALQKLEADYDVLNNALHPEIEEGTFERVDELIGRLLKDLISMLSHLEQSQSQSQFWRDQSARADSFTDKLFTRVLAVRDRLQSEGVLLDYCKTTITLEHLQAKRRKLLIQEFSSWDRKQLATELRKRERDLSDLPDVIKNEESRGGQFSYLFSLFIEERRFLQNCIIELEQALKAPPLLKAGDPGQQIRERIAARAEIRAGIMRDKEDLKRKHPDQRDEIERSYRKALDALEDD